MTISCTGSLLYFHSKPQVEKNALTLSKVVGAPVICVALAPSFRTLWILGWNSVQHCHCLAVVNMPPDFWCLLGGISGALHMPLSAWELGLLQQGRVNTWCNLLHVPTGTAQACCHPLWSSCSVLAFFLLFHSHLHSIHICTVTVM